MDTDQQKFEVEVVRPCFLQRRAYGPEEIGTKVLLPLVHAQDAVASGRCKEVDPLPRTKQRPY